MEKPDIRRLLQRYYDGEAGPGDIINIQEYFGSIKPEDQDQQQEKEYFMALRAVSFEGFSADGDTIPQPDFENILAKASIAKYGKKHLKAKWVVACASAAAAIALLIIFTVITGNHDAVPGSDSLHAAWNGDLPRNNTLIVLPQGTNLSEDEMKILNDFVFALRTVSEGMDTGFSKLNDIDHVVSGAITTANQL